MSGDPHSPANPVPVAKFIVPDLGDKVDYKVVVPAPRQATYSTYSRWQAGMASWQPYAGVSYIPHSGTIILATD